MRRSCSQNRSETAPKPLRNRSETASSCNAPFSETALKGEGGGGAAGEEDAAAGERAGADADQPRHGLAQPRGEGEGAPERMSHPRLRVGVRWLS